MLEVVLYERFNNYFKRNSLKKYYNSNYKLTFKNYSFFQAKVEDRIKSHENRMFINNLIIKNTLILSTFYAVNLIMKK